MGVNEVPATTGAAVQVPISERMLGEVVADALRDLTGQPATVDVVDVVGVVDVGEVIDLVDQPPARPAPRATGDIVIELDHIDMWVVVAGSGAPDVVLDGPVRVSSFPQLARAVGGGGLAAFAAAPDRRHGTDMSRLTDRELEVLGELRRGWTNPAIAEALGISVHTVRCHVGNIMRKLGTTSRVEAITQR